MNEFNNKKLKVKNDELAKPHLISMTNEHWEKLQALAKKNGLTSSAMIRLLINKAVDNNNND